MKSITGCFMKHRLFWSCHLSATVKTFDGIYSRGNRDVSIPLRLRSKDEISALRPMFYVVSLSQEALSPMIIHQNWFKLIEQNHQWMDLEVQCSNYYNMSWLRLILREQERLDTRLIPSYTFESSIAFGFDS